MKKEIEGMEDIRMLVDSFYSRVRNDEMLGPVFNERIRDWPKHLETMYRFWQTLLLHEQSYKGAPFPKHADLPVNAHHFDRWITLFHQTVDEYYEGAVAEEAKFRSLRIAEVFRYKLGLVHF